MPKHVDVFVSPDDPNWLDVARAYVKAPGHRVMITASSLADTVHAALKLEAAGVEVFTDFNITSVPDRFGTGTNREPSRPLLPNRRSGKRK